MKNETRDVSPVDAAAGEQQVVASASGKTAQFQLAFARLCIKVALRGSQRQSDVSLQYFPNRAESTLRLWMPRASKILRQPEHTLKKRQHLALRLPDFFGELVRHAQSFAL